MSLDRKRVVILGGTSGIGLATAEAAQREGAYIVVASSRRQRVDSAMSVLQGKAEGEVVDLSDEARVSAFFERIGAGGETSAPAPVTVREILEASRWPALGCLTSMAIVGSLTPGKRTVMVAGRVVKDEERARWRRPSGGP